MNLRLRLNSVLLGSIGALAFILLLLGACSAWAQPGQPPKAVSAASRTIRFADGETVTVTRTTITGGIAADEVDVSDPKGRDASTSWCTEDTGYYDGLADLFRSFKQAIVNNRKQLVVSLMRFPLQVNGGGQGQVMNTSADLLRRYEQVFPRAVIATISRANPQAVFCTSEGGSFGNGVVWARAQGGRTAIEVVNR
jgi:hypothetical protein